MKYGVSGMDSAAAARYQHTYIHAEEREESTYNKHEQHSGHNSKNSSKREERAALFLPPSHLVFRASEAEFFLKPG